MGRIRLDGPARIGLPVACALYAAFLCLPVRCLEGRFAVAEAGWHFVVDFPKGLPSFFHDDAAGWHVPDRWWWPILGWLFVSWLPNPLLWAGMLGLLLGMRHVPWTAG